MPDLVLLSDALLLLATAGMALWCRTLTRRLQGMDSLEEGLGGTVEALKSEVAELRGAQQAASSGKDRESTRLSEVLVQADDRIGRMEMLLASLESFEEDVPDRLHAAETGDPAPALHFRRSRDISAEGMQS